MKYDNAFAKEEILLIMITNYHNEKMLDNVFRGRNWREIVDQIIYLVSEYYGFVYPGPSASLGVKKVFNDYMERVDKSYYQHVLKMVRDVSCDMLCEKCRCSSEIFID